MTGMERNSSFSSFLAAPNQGGGLNRNSSLLGAPTFGGAFKPTSSFAQEKERGANMD